MTALRFPRLTAIATSILILAQGAAHAQETPASPPASGEARPTILPMTPGSTLGRQRSTTPGETTGKKAKVISVSPATPPAGTFSSKAPKSSPNDYTFCNKTSYVLSIAVGLRNGPVVFTRGWWPIPAGECKVVIKGPLNQGTYYSFARSSFSHAGALRTWGGNHQLCTGKLNFQATGSDGGLCGPGYIPQGFAAVDTNGKTGWLTYLSEGSQLKSMDDARVAGLQRLLSDIGLFEGAIDGVPGPKFNEAMSQARTALGINTSDPYVIYTKLLAEATRIQSAAGLTFCNRTQEIIITAFGREASGKQESRGWYRLLPEQCEKVLKERLSEPYIYAFATTDNTEGVPETWGGTKVFCTKPTPFDFEESINCTGKGFTSTGFFPIDTKGGSSVTFEFMPRRPASEGEPSE